MRTDVIPDRLPILSRGKHRSPRTGACFMELASYLAGERWSDHPPCTHPLLSAVARGVNDHTSDESRSHLALLIPSVIGLTSDDPHVDARVALLCARTALPIVVPERQRVMAVGVLSAERVLNALDGRPADALDEASEAALQRAPQAAAWARRFVDGHDVPLRGFRRHAAPSIVSDAITAVAGAGARNRDEVLHDMLVAAISECRRWVQPAPRSPSLPTTWPVAPQP